MEKELSVSDFGFTACGRHRDDTPIRGQLKHYVPVFSTEQFELIGSRAQINREPQLQEMRMRAGGEGHRSEPKPR